MELCLGHSFRPVRPLVRLLFVMVRLFVRPSVRHSVRLYHIIFISLFQGLTQRQAGSAGSAGQLSSLGVDDDAYQCRRSGSSVPSHTRVGRRRPRFVRGKTSSAPSEKMSDVDRRKRRPAVEILSSFFFPSFLPFASFSLDLSLTPSSEGPKFVALHVVVPVSSNRDDADEPDVGEEGERESARENLVQTAARCRRRARGSSSLR